MIRILILNRLRDEIYKTFKSESKKVINLIKSLKENPSKGKTVGNIGNIIIKELKYKTFRFYYIFEGHRLTIFRKDELSELLIKFIEMSKKNNQQKTIDEIKEMLKIIEFEKI